MLSLLGVVTLALCLPGAAAAQRRDAATTVRHIVVLKDHVDVDSPALSAQRMVETAPEVVFRHALKGFAVRLGAAGEQRIELLRQHPDVAYVARDRRVSLHGQTFQPGMERIRVRDNGMTAINDTRDVDLDVDIAILDTGIDATHPDLNVYDSVSFVAGDPSQIDPHGHGTHVAGIAGAIDDGNGVYGVAPGARLWAVKVIDQHGGGNISDVIAGLDYVAAHADQIDVANLSFGGPGLGDDGNCGATVGDPLHQAICAVVDAGVVVVVSAGNFPPYGRDASLISPASYDEVITVSAVVETDGLGPGSGQGPGTVHGADNAFAASFSNYGWDVDLAAPGVDVVSTWAGGGYATQSGTSTAAPHVAGAAALWIAKHGKTADRQQVLHLRDELVRLAFPQFGPHLGFSGDRETFAEPLLNVAAIDPAVFDLVEPQSGTDKPVYAYGEDLQVVVSLHLRNELGLPFEGLPGNGFMSFLRGQQIETQFQELGQGNYSLTFDIAGLLPGDYDFTTLIETVSGFERSAGCRILIRDTSPRLRIHGFSFLWPVMNHDSFFSTNYLHASLMDENGAPLFVPPEQFQTAFSGGGPELVWSVPVPDPVTGVSTGITYGAYQSEVSDIHSLPLGTYHADLTVGHDGLSDSATASFDMAYNEPALSAELTANLSSFDFTQDIAPPALDVSVEVTSEFLTGVPGLLYLVNEPFVVQMDGQAVPGVGFAETGSGVYAAQGLPIDALSGGTHQLVVHVTDSRGLEVDSNPVTIDVIRQTGPCAEPWAADGQLDSDSDGIRDECDNCPTVANPSQSNASSGDGDDAHLGDACKMLAKITVSSDAADNPDFSTIQQAVDQATDASAQVRIEILPGDGPYEENVVVDRDLSFRFVGKDTGSGLPVVEGSGSGNNVFDLRSAGASPIVLRGLVVRGQGVSADQRGISGEPGVSTRLSDLRFEQLEHGLFLRAGAHHVERVAMDASVGTGLVADEAALSLSSAEFRGLTQALRILGSSGSADVEHVLIVGNGVGAGISVDSSFAGPLQLRHSTVVGCDTAVAGSGNETIAHSILWNNEADVSGVACSHISWSDLQGLDCGGTNRSVDPLFVAPSAGDYRLQATSPLLDHGPDPGLYEGAPCKDLDGGPRLRDHDGDGLARLDPGAYERENTAIAPPEVGGLLWTGPATLTWSPEPTAVEYHVYRAPLGTLAYSAFGVCEDGLDASGTDTLLNDPTLPPAGEGFYYEITARGASGSESTLGVGSCAERSNFAACP